MTGLYQDAFVESLRLALQEQLAQWGFSAATSLSLLTVSENATFRALDPRRENPVVIRVHRPGYHSVAEIESELAWITALRADSVVVTPQPLSTREGGLIASFEHGGEVRRAVAFEFMAGDSLEQSGEMMSSFFKLGAITARLHAHAQQWRRPADFSRKTWDFDTTLGDHPHWGDWRQALHLTADGRAILERCSERLRVQLADYGKGAERFGLVHADLHPDNLLVDGDRLAVIDFDDCGFSWYMYDFAAAISYMETSPEVQALRECWVEGYRSVRALAQEDERAIPMFVMLRRMLLTAWIASHPETPYALQHGGAYTQGSVDLARGYLQSRD